MRRTRRQRPLHLLEVGVRWPPETFLGWKLEGLAARGMRVTVASRSIFDRAARLRGVVLIELPQMGTTPVASADLALRMLALLVTAPRRTVRLLRGIRQMAPEYRGRYGGTTGLLAHYLPVARLRPDVVHFEWSRSAALYLPMFDVWRCPVVTSCHGHDLSLYPSVPAQDRFADRFRDVLRSASAVHCVSDSLRQTVVDLGLEPAKARVIRQGVDPAAFQPAEAATHSDPATLRLIGIAWLRWMKGFEWALEAVRALVDSGVPVELEILGAGSTGEAGSSGERERVLHTVADLGLEAHVRLCGEVSSAEVARRLRSSDALLLPSLDEGLPTVLLEAMACGIPVVATDCGGVSEALTDGVEGFLVPPRDAQALADALARLWHDPALRARMGAAGRRTATTRFPLDRQLAEFLRMYEELARA